MNKAKAIVTLLRLPFLTVTVGGVAVGTAFAKWETGRFDLVRFLLALFGAACLHIATNVANDFFDFKAGTDAANRSGTSPFSGGSGILLAGLLKPREALATAVVFSLLGSAAGFYLDSVSPGHVILAIGAAGLFLVYNYNGWPLRLVNIGLGEVGIFLAWGPLMVFGAYYVQAGAFGDISVLGPCAISGILTTLVLLINEFADRDADRSAGRRTIVVLSGYEGGLRAYAVLASICYAVAVLGVALAGWPVPALAVLPTAVLPFQAVRIGRKKLGRWPEFLGAVKATILMNLLFLIILAFSFVM